MYPGSGILLQATWTTFWFSLVIALEESFKMFLILFF